MALAKFSSSLSSYEGQLANPALQDSLTDLQQFLGGAPLPLLVWSDTQVVLPLDVEVELPPLGNYEDLDIRAIEPVFIAFSLAQYPTLPPTVYTDRLDFPKDRLAHLYIAQLGLPPAFCLVRGSIKEWYANKRLRDVVTRTGNWLRDAAVGNLTLDSGQYDPLRLEGYTGTIIYPYDQFAAIIEAKDSWKPNQNFAMVLFENMAKEEEKPAFRFVKLITPETYHATLLDYIKATKELLADKTFKVKKYHIGYLLWSSTSDSYAHYSVNLPQSWEEFQTFCTSYGLNVGALTQFITQGDEHYNFFPELPIVCGLRRPKPVIGFSADLEFVNFFVDLPSSAIQEGQITTNPAVRFQAHNEPLTLRKARSISGSYPLLPVITFAVGCGALGSKIIMHLARNGAGNLVLVDSDKVSPHNLVRYALHAEAEGNNKALALASTIKNLYRHEPELVAFGLPQTGESIWIGKSAEQLNGIKYILDFTASEAFFTSLVVQPHLSHAAINRAVISDQGNLGILSLEGTERNPRLDDLQVALYAQGKRRPAVSAWLQREQATSTGESTLVTVGVGCNSETTILADEVISTHAAYVAQVLKAETKRAERTAQGQVFLSKVTCFDGYPVLNTERILVPKREVLTALNDSSWQIRLCPKATKAVRLALRKAYPNETGGVFIGQVNYKTKVIHVVDAVLAPPDSRATPVCFFRGVEGLPEAIGRAVEQSGGQLGYVGEWHTHPLGPSAMSATDHATVRRFKQEFEELPNPLPVFLLIATHQELLPFIY
ncbi:ThiF family adenylyltransferase [Hymenobacter sp. BT186]|uniref:ThiF family adenylyltransferase n=1 Tax=Hymenobacter telluris TaxID=2816474 RepID=A0A939F3Q6_9BACT|nr:ThiF family adenylyltransferase [Hymenobacter telluris]MBO0360833.1 ThiF family adenylyltransferase [Hymenobacter telluris]MBW3376862.1 ThiF family adenylyltransferase [Hymenobacter norwichensis]